jgi:hypothetical protein
MKFPMPDILRRVLIVASVALAVLAIIIIMLSLTGINTGVSLPKVQ